jgi:hypothetical protein
MLRRFASALLLLAAFSFPALAEDASERSLLGGKATVALPTGLDPLSDEFKKAKYGANPPQEVFGNERATVSFAATAAPYPGTISLVNLTAATAASLDKAGRVATWHKKGIRKIDGREFGILEFTAKAEDTDIYNYIYVTKRGDEMIVLTVNSTAGLLDEWRAKLEAVVASTRVTEP